MKGWLTSSFYLNFCFALDFYWRGGRRDKEAIVYTNSIRTLCVLTLLVTLIGRFARVGVIGDVVLREFGL